MKNFLVIVFIIILILFAYKRYAAQEGIEFGLDAGTPFSAYKEFANAVFNGNYERAGKRVTGDAVWQLQQKQQLFMSMRAFRGTISDMRFTLKSTKKVTEDQVKLLVTQTITGHKQGAVQKPNEFSSVVFNHAATVVRSGSGWKVESFDFLPARKNEGQTSWTGY